MKGRTTRFGSEPHHVLSELEAVRLWLAIEQLRMTSLALADAADCQDSQEVHQYAAQVRVSCERVTDANSMQEDETFHADAEAVHPGDLVRCVQMAAADASINVPSLIDIKVPVSNGPSFRRILAVVFSELDRWGSPVITIKTAAYVIHVQFTYPGGPPGCGEVARLISFMINSLNTDSTRSLYAEINKNGMTITSGGLKIRLEHNYVTVIIFWSAGLH